MEPISVLAGKPTVSNDVETPSSQVNILNTFVKELVEKMKYVNAYETAINAFNDIQDDYKMDPLINSRNSKIEEIIELLHATRELLPAGDADDADNDVDDDNNMHICTYYNQRDTSES